MVQVKRRKASGGSGMTEGQLKELMGRVDKLEEVIEERMSGLEKKLGKHVDGLTSRHKMEQTRLDAVSESLMRLEDMLGRVEGMMRRLEKKVEEMEDEEEEETLKDADGEAGKGKGKAKEADNGESGDESEERTDDE